MKDCRDNCVYEVKDAEYYMDGRWEDSWGEENDNYERDTWHATDFSSWFR